MYSFYFNSWKLFLSEHIIGYWNFKYSHIKILSLIFEAIHYSIVIFSIKFQVFQQYAGILQQVSS